MSHHEGRLVRLRLINPHLHKRKGTRKMVGSAWIVPEARVARVFEESAEPPLWRQPERAGMVREPRRGGAAPPSPSRRPPPPDAR